MSDLDTDVPEEELVAFYALKQDGVMFALPKAMAASTSIQLYYDKCAADGVQPESFPLIYTDVLLSSLLANMDQAEANYGSTLYYFAVALNDLVSPMPSQFGDDLAKADAWFTKLRKPPFNFQLVGPIPVQRLRTEWAALMTPPANPPV